MAADIPTFVVSLILSDDQDCQIVLGVRRPSLQASRHPGVLSTPTQRVPQQFFETCWPTWPVPTDAGLVVTPVVGDAVTVGGPGTSSQPLSYLVETLLVRKLALGAALAHGQVTGIATPVAIAHGAVDDPQGGGDPEMTVMLSVAVQLAGLRAVLPERTSYYAPLIFAPTGALAEALRHRDALRVSDLLDPFEVCIGGLCITSAVSVAEVGTSSGAR